MVAEPDRAPDPDGDTLTRPQPTLDHGGAGVGRAGRPSSVGGAHVGQPQALRVGLDQGVHPRDAAGRVRQGDRGPVVAVVPGRGAAEQRRTLDGELAATVQAESPGAGRNPFGCRPGLPGGVALRRGRSAPPTGRVAAADRCPGADRRAAGVPGSVPGGWAGAASRSRSSGRAGAGGPGSGRCGSGRPGRPRSRPARRARPASRHRRRTSRPAEAAGPRSGAAGRSARPRRRRAGHGSRRPRRPRGHGACPAGGCRTRSCGGFLGRVSETIQRGCGRPPDGECSPRPSPTAHTRPIATIGYTAERPRVGAGPFHFWCLGGGSKSGRRAVDPGEGDGPPSLRARGGSPRAGSRASCAGGWRP